MKYSEAEIEEARQAKRAYQKAYRKANPEKVKEWEVASWLRYAKKKKQEQQKEY